MLFRSLLYQGGMTVFYARRRDAVAAALAETGGVEAEGESGEA